jgi:putative ABC transport system substrate-binding protein
MVLTNPAETDVPVSKEKIKMKQSYRTIYFIIAMALISSLTLGACTGTSQKKMYTIGVVNLSTSFESILDGFKSGMEAEGFKEGENVTYLYDGPAANPDALVPILENFKNKKVDLILAFGTTATQKAKQALEGTNIPVIFGPVTDPVGSGIVTNLLTPGGNITGIRTGNPASKRLEWLTAVVPGVQHIYVFNNPKDDSSVQGLAALTKTASVLNVELQIRDASTAEEVDAGLSAIPEDTDAIFILASAFLEAQLSKFVDTTDENKLPLSAPATANVRAGALTSFGQDNVPLGEQASRLAVQIFRGVKPADLPIETAELFTSINLKTAETLGLNIPNGIIRQADVVVRQ